MESSSFSGLIVIVFLCVGVHVEAYGTQVGGDRPVMFIFGDSTVDVGTNNFLQTKAKANFPYYGIDFPNSLPTGRFSNGFNIIDHIAKLFGYEESPLPYMALRFDRQHTFDKDILGGVNFASGGSGILKDTGKQLGEVIPFDTQVEQFEVVKTSMVETLGQNETETFLSKALFIISVGGNDLLEFNSSANAVKLGQKQYLSAIQSTFYLQILNLYRSGARRFGIINVPAIGCCPGVRATNYGGKCVDGLNQFAIALNNATSSMLEQLWFELKDFRYSLGDSFAMTSAVLLNPGLYGIKETRKACCGTGNLNGKGPCLKKFNANLCEDRNDFLFWDWFHPTDNISQLAASKLYNGPPLLVFPINFRQLAQI